MPALCQESKIILPGELILNKKKPAATYFLRSLRSLPTFCSASLRKSRGGLSSQDTPQHKTAHKREKKCLFLRTGIQFKKKKAGSFLLSSVAAGDLTWFCFTSFRKTSRSAPASQGNAGRCRLQTRERKCLLPEICIELKEKAGSFLLSRWRAVSST